MCCDMVELQYMQYLRLTLSFMLCFFVAYAGSYVTTPAIEGWYASITKPFFNPPNWVFGPVWTILYAMMAYSFYLIWSNGIKTRKERQAVLMFMNQLFLNFVWSFVFFGLEQPLGGFVVIVLLWTAIYYTLVLFKRLNKTAAYLLIPYLLWVSFATLLNLFIVILN